MMVVAWPKIREMYRAWVDEGFPATAMLTLVEQIECSPYVKGIHAWTSLEDLNITQSAAISYERMGPYLRIRPMYNGTVEFCYVDTDLRAGQWRRVVPEDEAFAQLERFFDQLHWFARKLR